MALVDYERVMLGLKAHVASKRSHGADELFRRIAELEVECELQEGEQGYDLRPPREVGPAPRGFSEADMPASAVAV